MDVCQTKQEPRNSKECGDKRAEVCLEMALGRCGSTETVVVALGTALYFLRQDKDKNTDHRVLKYKGTMNHILDPQETKSENPRIKLKQSLQRLSKER